MCVGVPARIDHFVEGSDRAVVSVAGVKKEISLALVPEAAIGDYVIIHVGHALAKLNTTEAEQTLSLMAQLSQLQPQLAQQLRC